MKKKEKKLPKVGLRNVKTALSATLCAILYAMIDRNPTFACIGAIFGMGSDLEDSWRSGGNRLIGTVIGGFLGMGLFWVFLQLEPYGGRVWMLPLLFIGVILLILAAQIFHWPGAVQPGGVVLCIILFNTPAATYVAYSLNRMVDTGVGVLIALLVNLLLPRERLDRWLSAWRNRKKAEKKEKARA
ncbi:MAG: aromatic acid exporter family protein [Oscillospiraceae bacterium]